MVWECQACGYVYSAKAENGQYKHEAKPEAEGGLPAGWKCPVCGVGREFFEEVSGRNT